MQTTSASASIIIVTWLLSCENCSSRENHSWHGWDHCRVWIALCYFFMGKNNCDCVRIKIPLILYPWDHPCNSHILHICLVLLLRTLLGFLIFGGKPVRVRYTTSPVHVWCFFWWVNGTRPENGTRPVDKIFCKRHPDLIWHGMSHQPLMWR
jgi:hypothetical protein